LILGTARRLLAHATASGAVADLRARVEDARARARRASDQFRAAAVSVFGAAPAATGVGAVDAVVPSSGAEVHPTLVPVSVPAATTTRDPPTPAARRLPAGLTVGQALALDPAVPGILASHRLDGCPSCALRDDESLVDGARNHGVDVDALVRDLDETLARSLAGPPGPLDPP